MNPLDPLDAAMMTAELLSSPMHVGAVLILSPPARRRTGLRRRGVSRGARRKRIDRSQACADIRISGVDTGGMWVWRDMDTVDMSQHCQRRTVSGGP